MSAVLATLDDAIARARASACSTANAAAHSIRTGEAREAQRNTALQAQARLDDLLATRDAITELIEAAAYIAFAMRDGAVFERDHAAQRLAAARRACEVSP